MDAPEKISTASKDVCSLTPTQKNQIAIHNKWVKAQPLNPDWKPPETQAELMDRLISEVNKIADELRAKVYPMISHKIARELPKDDRLLDYYRELTKLQLENFTEEQAIDILQVAYAERLVLNYE